ncbi:MAG: hypothetical protein ABIA76_00485 [Candidatus Diapherotrites archaeon]
MKGKALILIIAILAVLIYFNALSIPGTKSDFQKIASLEQKLEVGSFLPAIEGIENYKIELISLKSKISESNAKKFIEAKINSSEGMLSMNKAKQRIEFMNPLNPDCTKNGVLENAKKELIQAREKFSLAEEKMNSLKGKLNELNYFSIDEFNSEAETLTEESYELTEKAIQLCIMEFF